MYSEEYNCTNDNEKTVDNFVKEKKRKLYNDQLGLILKRKASTLIVASLFISTMALHHVTGRK